MELREEMDAWLQAKENTGEHFHPDLELDFVIQGDLCVTVKDTIYNLKKDDFLLLNSGILHSVKGSTEDTVICCVKFSCHSVAEMAGEESVLFLCNSLEGNEPKYQEMRKVFHELVYYLVQRPHGTDCLKRSILYKLLDCLLEHFRLDLGVKTAWYGDDVKMMQIFQYVNRNFRYGVSLTELADRLYMSKSTLSRFFKKQTGIYFMDYINQVRLKYAMEDLLYSDKNITKIAVDCGFSNPSAFNKLFREVYGSAPTEYRAKEGRQERQKEIVYALNEKLRQELQKQMAVKETAAAEKSVLVRADTEKGTPLPKIWGRCINIGSAYRLTGASLQQHTLYLAENLGFTYARIWSIFSTKLMITDGRSKGFFNYDNLDGVLDFLTANHIVPFMDFNNRPDTAIYEPGSPVFCESEYITFTSKDNWQALFRDFILHITNRYGEREVSKWIFEFTCDPAKESLRRYYEDANYDYFDVFRFAFATIKEFVPEARVGGPMGEMIKDYEFVADFLRRCRENSCLPDFVSFMLFPYHTENGQGDVFSRRTTTSDIEREQVGMMRQLLKENGAEACALYITEWNNTLSNRNYLNDSCFRAAYIARKVSELIGMVDMLAVWMASDWMSSYYDTVKIANGGSGLLTKDSIRKPAYFALQFLHMMGNTLVAQGPEYIITGSGEGKYYILCFNYKWFGINYFVQKEMVEDPDGMKDIFEDENPLELEFRLDNMLPKTEYIIKKRTVGKASGSVLDEWKQFRYDRKLSDSDIRYIRDSCFPKMSMERINSGEGELCLHVVLQANEVALLHIYKA